MRNMNGANKFKSCCPIFAAEAVGQAEDKTRGAKMALNRSPEFKISNSKPSAEQLFGTLR